MNHGRNESVTFNVQELPARLREMYERRVQYVEEIIADIRSLSPGNVTQSFLEGVRARHIRHAQETVLEVALYSVESGRSD